MTRFAIDREHQRVAIRWRARDIAASKAAIGPRHVLDNERLPHLLGKPIGQGPRD